MSKKSAYGTSSEIIRAVKCDEHDIAITIYKALQTTELDWNVYEMDIHGSTLNSQFPTMNINITMQAGAFRKDTKEQ
jgi:hypothetical protein